MAEMQMENNTGNRSAGSGREPSGRSLVPAAAILGATLLAAGFVLAGGLVRSRAGERVVTVRGLAEREVEADLAVWPITFGVASDSLGDLGTQIGRGIEVILAFLAEAGVDPSDVTTAPPAIRDARVEPYGMSGEEEPFRYSAQATVLVRSSDVETVRTAMERSLELLGRGVAVARNYESQSQFIYTALNEIKPEMIAEATRNAREAARQFAEDSGSEVGKIMRATQGLFTIEDVDSSMPHRKIVRVVTTVDFLLTD